MLSTAAVVLGLALSAADVHAVHPEERVTEWFKVRVVTDVALPDGIAVGASLAPLPHLRLTAAALTNVIGFGARGGLQLVPFSDWTLHPLIGCEGGRYFNGRPRNLVENGPESFSYDFANLNAGLELKLGRFEAFAVGGVSRVWTRGALGETSLDFEATLPSAKAGIAVKLN